MDEPYFAELFLESKDDEVVAHVSNVGTEPLPYEFIHLAATVGPTDGSWSQPLDPPSMGSGGAVVGVGESQGIAILVTGLADGAYRVDAQLWLRDHDGKDVCFAQEHGFGSVLHGRFGPYQEDAMADAELGDELHPEQAAGDLALRFDPLPYLVDGAVVASVAVDGTVTLAAGSTMSVRFHQAAEEHPQSVTIDRDVQPGDSFSHTFDLPEMEQGNHPLMVEIEHHGGYDSQHVVVCYQAEGPVEVFYT